ncbi:sporulation protein [Flavobacterium sp. 316]|uniref:SPOR domain-containing protein n=1 Tax=Flavobacterium sp. 316 TaxID=1603293 RepID=UPI0005E117BE|nr:SPOR domain-containing protein [Flavobacterium sp. 316]KIX20953.1 sporulation protein [Flavobacterium sp. 316]
MRKLAFKNIFYLTIFSLFFITNSFSQESKTTVEQDSRFEKLLKEKQQINSDISIDGNYKIQIFYGEKENAKRSLMTFKRNFKDTEATIQYTNPTYKVWVGNYKLRIHAEKALIDIKSKYPTALLIRSTKE